MDSVKKKRPIKTTVKPSPNPVRRATSLAEGFALAGLKVKKLGTDWRFSNGATLVEDQLPHANSIPKIVEYMKSHPGTNITVTVASILKGAR